MSAFVDPLDAAAALSVAAAKIVQGDSGDWASSVGELATALTYFETAVAGSQTGCPAISPTLRPRRFADALRMVDPKTQNVAGLASSLISADAEVVAERGIPPRDPAVQLLAAQLIWVCGVDGTDHDFSSLIAECHRRVQAQQANAVA